MGVHYVILNIVLIKTKVEFGLDTTFSINITRKRRTIGKKETYTLVSYYLTFVAFMPLSQSTLLLSSIPPSHKTKGIALFANVF
jgi:hypothetical protein